MGNESIFKTLMVAVGVSAVCAVLVSVTAKSLESTQIENQKLDKKRNILVAAGVIDSRGYLLQKEDAAKTLADIKEEFARLIPQVIDLETGRVVEGMEPEEIEKIDPKKQVKSEADRIKLSQTTDISGIKFKPKQAVVYVLNDGAGKPLRYIFPIFGKGLWSTMYGYIALESDLNTVSNITFYDHGETPGLGGEISNPKWQAKWADKRIFDTSGKPVLKVFKGHVPESDPAAAYEVDGISGATLTGNGVSNTVRFWLGENGFGPYLKALRD
ncbi:MAG: Na(+)-translocating NADH-quinone reductase subunit C [Planctomycetaceae bacterium]|jgi:Na+-transporting NADH:ubiquinone oxidoreductase subunit C|nr:Na(+)-translocating NADH-quinone reductase subunit C [Planctomycetaceae bacterium]